MNPLELECMAHRYLYYVLANPVITDYEYDRLEVAARSTCADDSPLQRPGSDLESSYSEEVKSKAKELMGQP